MPVQQHVVVITDDRGKTTEHPMKEWLRENRKYVPPGLSPEPVGSTSHQLRSGLRKMGWTMEESPSKIRLIRPGDDAGSQSSLDDSADDQAAYFALEYQLRDFLAENLAVVDVGGRRLRLYVDANGEGVEYPTSTGPIDILAVDSNGDFFVLELKRGNSPDRAIGQLARYMGWIRSTIGRDKAVYGVIVARTISDKLRFAAAVVPNVFLFEYRVAFSLSAAEPIRNQG